MFYQMKMFGSLDCFSGSGHSAPRKPKLAILALKTIRSNCSKKQVLLIMSDILIFIKMGKTVKFFCVKQ